MNSTNYFLSFIDIKLITPLLLKFLVIIIFITSFFITHGLSQEIPNNLYKNANAIILNESKSIEYAKYDKYVMNYTRKIKILNKKADHFQSIYIHYKKGSEKINDLTIKVFNDQEEIIKKVKSSEIDDNASGDGYSIISDYRIKRWNYNTLKYPITIEYSYQKESKNTLSLPHWHPIPYYNVSVLCSTYNIISTLPLRNNQHQFEQYNIEKIGELDYKMAYQTAVKSESYSPSLSEIVPTLYIIPIKFSFEDIYGEFRTWNEYGQWIHKSFLSDKKLTSTESIKSDVGANIVAEDNKEYISRKIYKYLQKHTRYVSVSLDEGGLSPMLPNKVHDVGYGDCKALSFYMKSLLELYNIKSNYVEIAAESDYCLSLNKDFPSPYPGNHIILNIPIDKDTFWVDCTSNNNPFNFLGSFTDNRLALEINDNGGNLVYTPKYEMTFNRSDDTIVINIINQEKLITKINKNSYGLQIEQDLNDANLSLEKIEKHLKENVHKKLPIDLIADINIDVDNEKMSSNRDYIIESRNYLETAIEYTFIPTNTLSLEIPKLPKDSKRDHKILFPRSYSTTHTYIINLPETADLINFEEIENVSNYGYYKYELVKNESKQIIIRKTFNLIEGLYDAQEYNQIKVFFDKCLKSELKPLTTKKI